MRFDNRHDDVKFYDLPGAARTGMLDSPLQRMDEIDSGDNEISDLDIFPQKATILMMNLKLVRSVTVNAMKVIVPTMNDLKLTPKRL
ncbi:hypothetical protein AVEN_213736-1 [Araneus ventricosus]|uniref:Uncharacterized protein n=1 Tax=Araneus ventricosus TaxID=182803 RepID=A0A4Y2U3B1_ARAVE|nr:hypothetical protein AVEN_213736-1 [Araneus ventricosus]